MQERSELEQPNVEETTQLLIWTLRWILVGLAVVLVTFFQRSNKKCGKKLPGPWGMPYFGNVHQLGAAPHKCLMWMWKKYGDVFQIHLPNTPVLVLCGHQAVKEALLNNGTRFADRPYFESLSLPANGASLTAGHFSERWKMQKRLTMKALFTVNSNGLCSIEEIAYKEAKVLVQTMLKSQGPVDPSPMVSLSISRIIFSMLYGDGQDNDDLRQQILKQMDEFFKLFPALQARDVMPTVGKLFLEKHFKQAQGVAKNISNLFREEMERHRMNYDGVIRNTADAYISMSESIPENGLENGLTRQQIKDTLEDLVGAGNYTTSSFIRFAIRYMARYPNVQQKVQNELESVLGDSSPCMDKKRFLPYTEATFAEILRHASVVPLAIPCCTTDDTVFRDYFIPKKTVVFVNLKSVNHDPTIWNDPESFSPERFLTEEGCFNKSMQDKNIGVFSVGRRRCVGEAIASKIMFIVFCTLIQNITFKENSVCPVVWDEELKISSEPCPFKVEMHSCKAV